MADRTDELVFVALGGIGEIGMNVALYGYGPPKTRRWLMVDCGISFAGPDLPGIEVITADIAFIEGQRDRLDGIVITHAHEDHYGALYELAPRLKAPIHMTPFAAALAEAKRAGEAGLPDLRFNVVPVGGRVRLGPFDVQYIPVAHSIPESHSLAIRTPAGLVVHTGDWKIDAAPGIGQGTDLARFRALGDEGVLAVVGDSTNAYRDGESPSEADVAGELSAILSAAPGRVGVAIFASNVARIRAGALAAAAAGREVVVAGRAIRRAIEVSTELGMLDGLPPFLEESAFGYLPADRVVALLTGSQGEPRAALAKVASGEHREISFGRGDLVIFSSRTIPGNERAVNAIVNAITDRGARVMTGGLVHVSGHPRRGEISALYRALRPQVLIPAHGEAMHLAAHAELGRSLGIPRVVEARNGDIVRLAPGPAETVGKAETGRLVRDGRLLLTVDESGVAERRRIAFAGAVAVTLVLDGRGDLALAPGIAAFGLPDTDAPDMQDLIGKAVAGTVASIPRPRRDDRERLADAVRRAVRAAVNEAWGKKPVVTVSIARV